MESSTFAYAEDVSLDFPGALRALYADGRYLLTLLQLPGVVTLPAHPGVTRPEHQPSRKKEYLEEAQPVKHL
ncbi:MAG: hypothetical protein H7Z21_11730 [Hymenobacter sp.]|nr:hypothetical protein [Hymenobacter sp.]